MAEFSEVVKHWARYCAAMQKKIAADGKYYPCDGCPLESNLMCSDTAEAYTVDAMREVEDTVMAWAKDNPEPVYPSWGEWLQKLYNNTNYAGIFITPIPADIAQKLGIEPKEAR